LAGLYVLVQDRGQSFSPPEAVAEGAAPGIAVLPFDIRGPGLDVWREGMVDVLSTNLDGVAGLRTIDSRTVLARWRERVRGTESPDLATALEVARRTGARYALVGNAVATGPDVRFAADLYEVEGGRNIGQGQVAGPPDSVLALVDRLSIEVLRALMRGEEGKLPQVRLTSVTTASLPALKAYLEGEGHFRRSDFEEAIRAYRRAIEADSTFALALYRLGLSYGWIEGIRSDLPTRYVERAARLADRLPPREALIVKGDLALQRASLEGLTILQQAVREYPEDAEAWYLLGDTYVHLGPQGLTAQEEVEKALSRALELDPTFAPAYIHYLEYAFSRHADSALAAERVAAYGKLASGGEKDVENRLAFALAFGDSSARSQARSALDTLQLFSLGDMSVSYLTHPRLWRAQSAVLAAASRRELEDDDRLFFLIRFLFSTFNRGKLQEMLETLDDPGTPAGARAGWLYFFFMQGMSVPPDRLEEELRPAEADSFPDVRTFYVGAYAADRERWADHAAAVARLREDAKSLHAAGDSASAAKAEGTALALEGYASWRRGRADEALRLLQAAQQRATGYGPEGAINATIRWWLGRLLQESGRPREAERYFSSFWQSPLAAYHLGKVYEELEDYEKARSSYEFFAEAWRDADPELQPMVEEARAAISRLTSVIRE
jgi:tetratricopeptide (TPR) repeat protein/TolB-like protein